MAIAKSTKKSKKIDVIDVPSNIKDLQVYLKNLRGTKILTIEESSPAKWLYSELKAYVDKIIVCDPYRNRLLSEGAKTDKIDAIKLNQLLRADLLKEVFQPNEKYIYLRKITSAYDDLVRAGVRIKNQRKALYNAVFKDAKKDEIKSSGDRFILEGIERGILAYEEEKKRYEKLFIQIAKNYNEIKLLKGLPGIKNIQASKIVATVVDAKRFPNTGHFLSYCGLVKLDRISGNKCYGKKKPRYCRVLKTVFNMAAHVALMGKNNPMIDYYNHLIDEKKYSEKNAKQAVKRRLAVLSFGIMKNNKKYDPYMWRKKKNIKKEEK